MGGRDDRRDQSGRRGSQDDEYRSDRGGDQYGGRSTGYGQGAGDQYDPGADDGTYGQQGGQGGYQQGGYQQGGQGQGGGYPDQGAGGYGSQPHLHTDVLGKRIGAHIIDNLLLFFLALVLLLLIGAVGAATGPTTSSTDTVVGGVALIVGLGGALFYLFLLEGYWNGQTVGKRAVNIRVVNEDGSEIGYAESVLRNFIEIFEGLFYYIPAIIVIAISDRDQRLGDHAASTVVVDDDPDPRGPPQGYGQQPPQQGSRQPPQQGHQQRPQGQGYQQQPPRGQGSQQPPNQQRTPQGTQQQSGEYQYSEQQDSRRDQGSQ